MADEQSEIEDDPAEMIEHFILDHFEGNGINEVVKQQFRDALAKFIDARIALAARNQS